MTQLLAMLLDAYRELNSKKLFWVTLFISGIVVVVYASIGFNQNGMSMFYGLWNIESEFINEGSPIARMLYRSIFSTFIVGLWLAWVAVILALISTTTIFPDFIANGAIDLILAKPIGRVRLFIVKYMTSLLFVLLQVTLFCGGVFLCMGWRIDEWNWKIFAAVPLLVLFFSYLYSVNVLIGVLTRSSLTALLLTMLFWFSLWGLNVAEGIVTQFHTQYTVVAEHAQEDIATYEQRLSELDDVDETSAARKRLADQIDYEQGQREEAEEIVGKLDPWRRTVRVFQSVMPKTSETVGLLDRWLKEDTDVSMLDLLEGNLATDESGNIVPERQDQDREVALRVQEEYESRSTWYVLGSSVLFEAFVLCLACWFFVRRDY